MCSANSHILPFDSYVYALHFRSGVTGVWYNSHYKGYRKKTWEKTKSQNFRIEGWKTIATKHGMKMKANKFTRSFFK